jgi:hypothetical protein
MFTDYRPRCDADMGFQSEQSALQGSYAYRQYMIHNAERVIAHMRDQSHAAAYSGLCKNPYDVGTMLPEGDRVVCDKVACRRVPGAPGGVGTGREYGQGSEQTQRARAAFLEQQERMQAASAAAPGGCGRCSAASTPDGSFRPLPGSFADLQLPGSRSAVPSGGAPFE